MKKLIIVFLLLVACSSNEGKTEEIVKTEKTIEKKEDETVLDKIEINPNVDVLNDNNESELLVAVHNNDVVTAIDLIKKGANVNLQDNISDSPYLYAGAQGRLEILTFMLDHAHIDFTVVNRFGGNTLIPAAEKGHLETVKVLVADNRIDIDFQNNFGYTALIEAVALTDGSQVYQDIVTVLLEAGANPNIEDNYGKTAFDYAVDKGYKEIERILIQY